MWGSQDLGVSWKQFFSVGERKLAFQAQHGSLEGTGKVTFNILFSSVIRHSVMGPSAWEVARRGGGGREGEEALLGPKDPAVVLGGSKSGWPALPISTLQAACGRASEMHLNLVVEGAT